MNRRVKKYRFNTRTFLNADKNLRAYIIAYVRESRNDDYYTDIQLEIADCNRQISLDFDFSHNKKSIVNAERKIKLFRSLINQFADAVEAELAFMKAKPPLKKSRKKKGRIEEVEIALD